jgi:carbon-monoxide dehydrogenase large subunit
MALGRPVRWVEDRNEHFRATTHARESIHDYRIAARSDGTILAMEDIYTNDLGARLIRVRRIAAVIVFSGPYRVTDGHVGRRVVVTNKTPVGAYRGFGQPEVNFAYERLMDRLARRLDMDPVELRALNMVKAQELPWVNPVGAIYDTSDYESSLRAAAAVDYDRYRVSGRGRRTDGRWRGIGFSADVERTGTHSSLIQQDSGAMFGVDIYTGVSSSGQGSETVFPQMCSEFIGVDYERVAVHVGDTAASPLNTGGFASRTVSPRLARSRRRRSGSATRCSGSPRG